MADDLIKKFAFESPVYSGRYIITGCLEIRRDESDIFPEWIADNKISEDSRAYLLFSENIMCRVESEMINENPPHHRGENNQAFKYNRKVELTVSPPGGLPSIVQGKLRELGYEQK